MARGGRQYGAGRPPPRDKIENLDFIDAVHWHRNGVLQAGEEGHCYTCRAGSAPIEYSALHDAHRAGARHRLQEGDAAHPAVAGALPSWRCGRHNMSGQNA